VGAILLSGLFLYDIFWVFGTDHLLEGDSVMVTVAKGLDAPIKLLFPRVATAATVGEAAAAAASAAAATAPVAAAAVVAKVVVTNFAGENLEFSMLGLGDIVIPGFFLALLLRFDAERGAAVATDGAHGVFAKPYFTSGMAAYVAGLATTVYVMEAYKAAQVINRKDPTA
jgi:minor histocompatibility antigen H13